MPDWQPLCLTGSQSLKIIDLEYIGIYSLCEIVDSLSVGPGCYLQSTWLTWHGYCKDLNEKICMEYWRDSIHYFSCPVMLSEFKTKEKNFVCKGCWLTGELLPLLIGKNLRCGWVGRASSSQVWVLPNTKHSWVGLSHIFLYKFPRGFIGTYLIF